MRSGSDDIEPEWEELGWIDVATAGVAFRRAGIHSKRTDRELRSPAEPDGWVYQATMVDCPLPVEVRRDALGEVVAARMCFTDDVDVLDGTWREIGGLALPEGRCEACDPDCDEPAFRLTFDVRPGRYSGSVFDYSYPDGSTDTLGLKITRLNDPRI